MQQHLHKYDICIACFHHFKHNHVWPINVLSIIIHSQFLDVQIVFHITGQQLHYMSVKYTLDMFDIVWLHTYWLCTKIMVGLKWFLLSGTIWNCILWSTFAQVMICCLKAIWASVMSYATVLINTKESKDYEQHQCLIITHVCKVHLYIAGNRG